MLKVSTKISKKGLPKELATVTEFNIKPIEHESYKNSVFTRWGFFVELVIDNGAKITCVWKLYKTPNSNLISPFHEHFNSPTSLPYILRSLGVLDMSNLAGAKIKVRRNGDCIRVRGLKKDELDAPTDDKSKTTVSKARTGFWSFPDMFCYDDLNPMITKERISDLIELYPQAKAWLLDAQSNLLKAGELENTPAPEGYILGLSEDSDSSIKSEKGAKQ